MLTNDHRYVQHAHLCNVHVNRNWRYSFEPGGLKLGLVGSRRQEREAVHPRIISGRAPNQASGSASQRYGCIGNSRT